MDSPEGVLYLLRSAGLEGVTTTSVNLDAGMALEIIASPSATGFLNANAPKPPRQRPPARRRRVSARSVVRVSIMYANGTTSNGVNATMGKTMALGGRRQRPLVATHADHRARRLLAIIHGHASRQFGAGIPTHA